VRIDRTAPEAPRLLTPRPEDRVAAGLVALTGTAEPFALVIAASGGQVARATAAADGAWVAALPLGAGLQRLTLTATDAAGNVSAPSEVQVSIASPAPKSGCGCGFGSGDAASALVFLGLLAAWPRRRVRAVRTRR